MEQCIKPKDLIRDTAYDLFHEQGFNSTSMRDIATVVGMTKAGLYHHFESKEALMLSVLEGIRGYLNEQLFTIAYDTDVDPTKQLKKFFKRQEELFLGNQRACFIGNMTLETCRQHEDFAMILESIFKDWEDALTHLYGHIHVKKKAKDLAQQTVIEFEGAVMLGVLRKKDNKIIKNAIARALARLTN